MENKDRHADHADTPAAKDFALRPNPIPAASGETGRVEGTGGDDGGNDATAIHHEQPQPRYLLVMPTEAGRLVSIIGLTAAGAEKLKHRLTEAEGALLAYRQSPPPIFPLKSLRLGLKRMFLVGVAVMIGVTSGSIIARRLSHDHWFKAAYCQSLAWTQTLTPFDTSNQFALSGCALPAPTSTPSSVAVPAPHAP